MERLIFLSHAKLQTEDLDIRCLRKAVLVQNALRLGIHSPTAAVVPDEGGYPFDGPGRLFRTRSTHDPAMETFQQAPRIVAVLHEHQPHHMVDVTADITQDSGSPPLSPEHSEMMDPLDYGVVPTAQQRAYATQPLLVDVTEDERDGRRILAATLGGLPHSNDEEVPQFTHFEQQPAKRPVPHEDAMDYLPACKRAHFEAESPLLGDIVSPDWMQ